VLISQPKVPSVCELLECGRRDVVVDECRAEGHRGASGVAAGEGAEGGGAHRLTDCVPRRLSCRCRA